MHDFARLDIAQEVCAYRVERARFACYDYVVVIGFTYAQRTDTVGVAYGDELIARHNSESVRAFEFGAGAFYTRYDIAVR